MQSASGTSPANGAGGRPSTSYISQLVSLILVAFQLGHLVFSFANRVVPRDEQLR
jgi:hypothetical protein